MVRAFDDAEVIHVEGDVDPIRDMEIIQTELRLKDIEWVEKHLEGLKRGGRALGSNSLADKAKKEEIVRQSYCTVHYYMLSFTFRLLLRRSTSALL
jgi:ribosome-binding ATPase YchF (GTP1/OBG family)